MNIFYQIYKKVFVVLTNFFYTDKIFSVFCWIWDLILILTHICLWLQQLSKISKNRCVCLDITDKYLSLSVILLFTLEWSCSILVLCNLPHLLGDGYCNDETNNPECKYDGGDCCFSGTYNTINTDYCSECICYLEEVCSNPTEYPIPWIGDGFCDDQYNIPECNYDGGDCCGSCTNTNHCTKLSHFLFRFFWLVGQYQFTLFLRKAK